MVAEEPRALGRDFRARRSLLAVPVPAGLVVVALALGANRGAVAMLVIALTVVSVIAVLIATTWRASIVNGRLQAGGRPPLAPLPSGGVDLHALSKLSSVGLRYGMFVRLGPPLLRPLILIQDRHGGEVWIWAWGWEDRGLLMEHLREGVLESHAKMDPLTFWRLGFKQSGNRTVSRWRRFI